MRRAALKEYRNFRLKCLQYIHGEADSSVMNQVHGLAWYTAVFRTLNEARRIEPDRRINGATWELITTGYANLMALGIRRLVDRDPRTDSVWNVVVEMEKRPELLRRENLICYDGLPYDYQAAMERQVKSGAFDQGKAVWVSTKGPDAWGTSQLLHDAFDAVAGHPTKRTRLDPVQPEILANLKSHLEHETIQAVCTMANKTIAHAERLAKDSNVVPLVTYNMVDQALQNIVQVASFLSSDFFYDAAFGSIVPGPQFDVLESLDQPWVRTENLQALHAHWHEVSEALSKWADGSKEIFLPPNPTYQRDA